MTGRKKGAIVLFLLLLAVLLGIPAYHGLFGTTSHRLQPRGDCLQGITACVLEDEQLTLQLAVGTHSVKLHASQPLNGVTLRIVHETGALPPVEMYSVGDRREWVAASAESLAEFPGETIELQLTARRDDQLFIGTLHAAAASEE